jgi:LPS sulfotransferase NodH
MLTEHDQQLLDELDSSNYVVILINNLRMNGEVGEPHTHIFHTAEEFAEWYNKEEQERWSIGTADTKVHKSVRDCVHSDIEYPIVHKYDCFQG